VHAKASREETTTSSKRGIMTGMLETSPGLAMKKTARSTLLRPQNRDQENHSQPCPEQREDDVGDGCKGFPALELG
jgi:hypothetical protein